jgi:hypothetical protein
MMANLVPLLAGANVMGFLVGALLFFGAMRKTRDLLFGAFSISFLLLAAAQIASGLGSIFADQDVWVFSIRCFAFLILIVTILGKNIGTRTR